MVIMRINSCCATPVIVATILTVSIRLSKMCQTVTGKEIFLLYEYTSYLITETYLPPLLISGSAMSALIRPPELKHASCAENLMARYLLAKNV